MSGVRQDSALGVTQYGLRIPPFDYVDNTGATSDTDVFKFYIGGSGGTLLATVTVVYTSSAKSTISTVTRVPQLTT